jgi:hypothetical protein
LELLLLLLLLLLHVVKHSSSPQRSISMECHGASSSSSSVGMNSSCGIV